MCQLHVISLYLQRLLFTYFQKHWSSGQKQYASVSSVLSKIQRLEEYGQAQNQHMALGLLSHIVLPGPSSPGTQCTHPTVPCMSTPVPWFFHDSYMLLKLVVLLSVPSSFSDLGIQF